MMTMENQSNLKLIGPENVARNYSFKAIDNRYKFIGIQRCTAYESTVNIWLMKQFFCITPLYTASIKNRNIIGNGFTVFFRKNRTQISLHFLCLCAGSRFTSAYRPDRFISNYNFLQLF